MYLDPKPFEFRQNNSGEIWDQINKLNTRKASPVESLAARIFKEYSDIFSEILQRTFNEDLSNMKFLKELKLGDNISLHKNFILENHGITNYSLHSWFSTTNDMWFQKEL